MKTEDYMKRKLRLLELNSFCNVLHVILMVFAVAWLYHVGS